MSGRHLVVGIGGKHLAETKGKFGNKSEMGNQENHGKSWKTYGKSWTHTWNLQFFYFKIGTIEVPNFQKTTSDPVLEHHDFYLLKTYVESSPEKKELWRTRTWFTCPATSTTLQTWPKDGRWLSSWNWHLFTDHAFVLADGAMCWQQTSQVNQSFRVSKRWCINFIISSFKNHRQMVGLIYLFHRYTP